MLHTVSAVVRKIDVTGKSFVSTREHPIRSSHDCSGPAGINAGRAAAAGCILFMDGHFAGI